MAEKPISNVRKFRTDSTDDHILHAPYDGWVGTWAIHLVKTTGSPSLVVKARSAAKEAADDAVAFVNIPYTSRYLNAATSSDTQQASGTAITDTSVIYVNGSGVSIALTPSTGSASAYFTVYATPLAGVA